MDPLDISWAHFPVGNPIADEYRAGLRCTARRSEGRICLEPAEPGTRPWPLCTIHRSQLEREITKRVEAVKRKADRAVKEALDETHVVYFLQREDGMVKIGYTSRLATRYASLCGMHGPLEVLGLLRGGKDLERRLHVRFWKERMGATEWFQPTNRILRAAVGARYKPSARWHGQGPWQAA